jgi:hypothetical protein
MIPLSQFLAIIPFKEMDEIDKVSVIAFYYFRNHQLKEFNVKNICSWFDELHLSKPNTSRLVTKMTKSKKFIKASPDGKFKLHANIIIEYSKTYNHVGEDNSSVVTDDSIIPEGLVRGSRGYLENLTKQINLSYENNICDGCAVLMRRFLEILLILSYQNLGLDNEIRNLKGEFEFLEKIITNAKQNTKLALSRNSKSCLDIFREIGNFAAHKIEFNTRKSDIRPHILQYRALIEELLYKAGIK